MSSSDYSAQADYHEGSPDFIITGNFGYSAQFVVANLNSSEATGIQSIQYYIRGYFPDIFTYDTYSDSPNSGITGLKTYPFVQISHSAFDYKWMVGILNDPTYKQVYASTRSKPQSIRIRQTGLTNNGTDLYK